MSAEWREHQYQQAAELIEAADSLLIAAGAGMGVDSGLPDFRGPQGFWRAYPALEAAGIRFEEMANPRWFRDDPRLAWGFYGHRLNLYRATTPHAGFGVLQAIAAQMRRGSFVFTSNVDGQFQRAGFAEQQIDECHGSIHHLQCVAGCGAEIWSAAQYQPEVDEATCRLLGDLPTCPACGALARPNILMFGDWDWQPARSNLQQQRLQQWLAQTERPLVIEIGAGRNVPTVRYFSELNGWRVIRINPREPDLDAALGLEIPQGGREALQGLAAVLRQRGFLP